VAGPFHDNQFGMVAINAIKIPFLHHLIFCVFIHLNWKVSNVVYYSYNAIRKINGFLY
jgi:hypothetical protein